MDCISTSTSPIRQAKPIEEVFGKNTTHRDIWGQDWYKNLESTSIWSENKLHIWNEMRLVNKGCCDDFGRDTEEIWEWDNSGNGERREIEKYTNASLWLNHSSNK